ncbi:hypothetical protein [Sandaracinus amylolyticus]|uniref:hypothetical protein n=1 Tax=Sandaracinus amylolyticus TaxID=927083 RepID=UPI001F292673|nr:hypothetical protein [Sandaracinus amylolyticus]UJR81642.1 Hypothetical protein I5071_37020 [Sandaracinus amylolyticus]
MRTTVLAIAAIAMLAITPREATAQYGGMVPRHCGMSAGYETYGPLAVGSIVTLGMHTPWAGDANWTPEMNGFVGRTARVTQLAGVDTAGCPGVRVDADGGQYFWRIRDAQIAGGLPMEIPRVCDMSAAQYGPIGPGTMVLLGLHAPWRGDANWAAEMNAWVGRMARVTSLEGIDGVGCPVVRVDVDGGQYYWRVRDMQLAGTSMPMGLGAALPRWCGMTDATTSYGPIVPGAVIVLGRHSPWNGDTNWAAEMERFVGVRARVTQLSGIDTMGCPGVRVDVDGGQFFWRIRDVGF